MLKLHPAWEAALAGADEGRKGLGKEKHQTKLSILIRCSLVAFGAPQTWDFLHKGHFLAPCAQGC